MEQSLAYVMLQIGVVDQGSDRPGLIITSQKGDLLDLLM